MQRARKHGPKALFSRREFPTTSTTRLRVGTRGFERVGNQENCATENQARLFRSQGDRYVASAFADDGVGREEPVELARVHMRTDMDVSEEYRSSLV